MNKTSQIYKNEKNFSRCSFLVRKMIFFMKMKTRDKMEGYDARFQIPSNMMIVGPTSSGKTTWLKNLLKHKKEYFNVEPQQMLLFYKEHQKFMMNWRKL